MVKKKTGISRDLIIHPGETIADILEERCITQAELAIRTGVSAAYVSKVLSGEKDISSSYALKLEYALGISKKFWLRLQANYDAELLEYKEYNSIDETEREIFKELNDIVVYIKERYAIPEEMTEDECIIFLRKVLRISNLANLEKIIPRGIFNNIINDNINTNIVGAWVCLCLNAGKTAINIKFSNEELSESIEKLKNVMSIQKADKNNALERLLAYYNIDKGIERHIYTLEEQEYMERVSNI